MTYFVMLQSAGTFLLSHVVVPARAQPISFIHEHWRMGAEVSRVYIANPPVPYCLSLSKLALAVLGEYKT